MQRNAGLVDLAGLAGLDGMTLLPRDSDRGLGELGGANGLGTLTWDEGVREGQ